ncbi:hypothetical protein NDU88_003254 [Pleurodeles waltl]|uniref:CCHC-type domain-containing protein n=1 Tax=Pleurodeles waltl TaxID=8319 RepID=A0AAV7MSW5_PLEWA|nr:hypothetical protein NDU88_003254 [Pleurodeles waltl]
MHCLGCEGLEVFETLPEPEDEGAELNEFELCIKKLDLHYLPKISTILERYHFGMREQGQNESIEEYVTALRKLAATCKFGVTLEERIRDQFMLKCSSDKIRQELWSKDDPTLHEVITIAKGAEHTLACVGELEKNKYPSVNKIGPKSESQENNVLEVDGKKDELKLSQIQKSKFKDTKCFRCGNLGHFASYKKCPAIAAVCKLCGKRGHFAKCCRSQKELPSTSVKMVQDCILMVDDRVSQKKYPKDIVNLGCVMCEVLFDSGAWLTLMSNETFDKYLSHSVKLKNPDVVPGGYGGQTIELRGYFESKIEFKSNSIVGKIYVPVKGDSVISCPHQKDLEVILDPNNPTPVILKKDFKNDGSSICEISDVVNDSNFPDFVNEFKNVFSDTLGCLTKGKMCGIFMYWGSHLLLWNVIV